MSKEEDEANSWARVPWEIRGVDRKCLVFQESLLNAKVRRWLLEMVKRGCKENNERAISMQYGMTRSVVMMVGELREWWIREWAYLFLRWSPATSPFLTQLYCVVISWRVIYYKIFFINHGWNELAIQWMERKDVLELVMLQDIIICTS